MKLEGWSVHVAHASCYNFINIIPSMWFTFLAVWLSFTVYNYEVIWEQNKNKDKSFCQTLTPLAILSLALDAFGIKSLVFPTIYDTLIPIKILMKIDIHYALSCNHLWNHKVSIGVSGVCHYTLCRYNIIGVSYQFYDVMIFDLFIGHNTLSS